MAIALEEVLRNEIFKKADPVLRAGARAVGAAQVRWVHSSEVLDIAPLLSGGELLLTGGGALAGLRPAEHRRYIDDLAARRIAALAIESGGPLPHLPPELIRAADEAGLPLIELRKVAPFVQITQAINSILVSHSVGQLQRADVLSQELAAGLANGSGLKQLMTVLANRIPADVALLDRAGWPFESADAVPPVQMDDSLPEEPVIIDILQRGSMVGSLRLRVPAPEDRAWARVAGERAASILALALQERHSPSLSEVAGRELMRSISADVRGARLSQLCGAAGLDAAHPVVMAIVRHEGGGQRWAGVEQLIRNRPAKVITYINQQEMLALVCLAPAEARRDRTALVHTLAAGLAGQTLVAAVGPVGRGIGEAAWSLSEAKLTFDLTSNTPAPGAVLDAEAFTIERLASKELDDAEVRHLVFELAGEVIEYDRLRGSRLLPTLDAWLISGCNTAETARMLHLERQSMHNRLQRIFGLIGGDPRGTDRLAGLHVAVRLARRLSL